ncbi:MAG: haloacid dehalogenase, partial [Verrucomicrobiales bacterium]|nr:haloacid dehalogenase [Verrucomicrobiales bacterium]
MIRLILFDIDGTLIRTGGAGVRAFAKTFATEFNLPEATRDLNFSGRTDPSLVRECFKKHRIELTPENFEHFFGIYPHWLAYYLHELDGGPCPGVFEMIRELKGLPKQPVMGLLTGNIRLGAEIKLRHYDLWDPFVMGAFADEHEDRNQLA